MRANDEQLEYVQQRVAHGEYRVDSQKVAKAILARIGATDDEREAFIDRGDGRDLLRALTGLRAA